MTDKRPMLVAEGLRMAYPQRTSADDLPALDGIDLTVYEGEFYSIVGPSGGGKTTFLNLADGQFAPTSGSLLLDGRAVGPSDGRRAMVFQDASLLPWRTVIDNVTYGLECREVPRRKARELARPVIDMVGLHDFEQHYPHELSGGMQQRVNLARALAVDPQILLMDEPFAALDAQTREIMQEELLRVWREAGKTILFVTHQINEAVFLSDRVAVFSARPARVKAVLEIDIPRPRRLADKRDPRFLAYEDEVWRLIEGDVRQAVEHASAPARPAPIPVDAAAIDG